MDNTNFQTIHQMGNAINNVVRQATGRDAVQNIDMDYVTVAQRKRAIEGTATGNPASFVTNNTDPLKSLLCNLAPVQDLHGYDHPWVGGAGRNIAPITVDGIKSANSSLTWSGNSVTTNGVTFTIDTDTDGNVVSITANTSSSATANFAFILYYQKPLATGSYTISGCPSGYAGVWIDLEIGSGTYSNKDAGSGASVTISEDATVSMRFRVANGTTFNNVKIYPMLRLSTDTDTSYEPYTNICPISGHRSVEIVITGNLIIHANTINFPSEAGTVYGGTLTINDDGTGTLVVKTGYGILGNMYWTYSSSQKRFYVSLPSAIFVSSGIDPNLKCSHYPVASYDNLLNQSVDQAIGGQTANGSTYLSVRDTNYSTVFDFNSAMQDATFIFKLATPITYTLTTPVIHSLLGENNIRANYAEDVTVTYTIYEEVI